MLVDSISIRPKVGLNAAATLTCVCRPSSGGDLDGSGIVHLRVFHTGPPAESFIGTVFVLPLHSAVVSAARRLSNGNAWSTPRDRLGIVRHKLWKAGKVLQ